MNCKICGAISDAFANGKILSEYLISYYQCKHCGFIQTEEPFWLEESYSQAINDSDIGIVSRNIEHARLSKTIISIFFNSGARFVDYGGGYGMFVRLMRDYGFDFYRSEKYCQNLFAKGFDLEEPSYDTFELLTSFEVFEHFLDPVTELDNLLKLSPNILFSTALIPPSNPKPEEWWYYGLDHGQHISFYTVKSLQYLANSKGLNLYTNSRNLHLFTKKKMTNFLFKLICSNVVSIGFSIIIRRAALRAADYEKMTGKRMMSMRDKHS